jgi:pimeloyl-ACP methyl ester carboxylesterase
LTQLTFESYQQQASYIDLYGHRIAYWQSLDFVKNADKETILFIHGFPSAAWDWHYQWQHLTNQYRLICLDLLGFGLSDKPINHQYSLLEQADIVEALLKEKNVTSCHVISHDYGDSVAQELLSRQSPKSFSMLSLCLLNGGLFASHHRPLFIQKLLKGPLGNWVAQFMNKNSMTKSFRKIFGKHSQPKHHEFEILWQLIEFNNGKKVIPKLLTYLDERKVHGERWKKAMINTPIPLYFINGVQDPISGQHMLDYYIDIIPNPKTTALDVGHYPQLEAPETVLSLYKGFLDSVDIT